MRRDNVARWVMTGFVVLMLAACGKGIVYGDYQAVTNEGWSRMDTLSFTAVVTMPDENMDVYVDVRHGNDYPYRNLALAMTSIFSTPIDTLIRTDTLRLTLADDEGRWTGEGFANFYHNTSYVTTLRLDTPATCRFLLLPAMTDSLLKGISDIGVRLTISSVSRGLHQSVETRIAK